MSVRTGVVIHEYTYRKLLVGVLLLFHFYTSCIARIQAAKLGIRNISPSQHNYGGRSFLSYTSGHVLGEKHVHMSCCRSRTSGRPRDINLRPRRTVYTSRSRHIIMLSRIIKALLWLRRNGLVFLKLFSWPCEFSPALYVFLLHHHFLKLSS